MPDVSNADADVQTELRQRHEKLQAAIARPGMPAGELAVEYGELGKLFIATEYLDAAEACLENAHALAPADMRWVYYLAHVARYGNNPAKAATLFEQSVALSPAHVPSLVWLAEMYLGTNRPDAAAPILERARSLDQKNAAVLFGLGRVALAKQDYAGAVTSLEGALALRPVATSVHYPLAMAYRGLGNRAKAEEHLRLRGETALPPADPLLEELAGLLQNAAAYEARGSRALEAKQWADAVTNLRKAVELAPANAFSRLNLGTSLYMTGDADGALEQYREAVRLSPDLARAHFSMGVLLEERGRDRDAITAFRSAVAAQPDYAEARFSLANALRRTGRVADSLTEYDAILRVNPAVSQASFGYTMGLVRLGRYQEARARLEKDANAFPDQPGFAHALARLMAAAPDDRVRDGKASLALMQRLLELQRTLGLLETMAMTQAELGRFNDAVTWQREAIDAARNAGRKEMLPRLEANLRLYAGGQPCRTPWADDDPVHFPRPAPD